MTRIATGLCVAAALSVATLGAQTPSSATSPQQRPATTDAAKDITITGCLSKGADGNFVLNNAKLDNPASATTAGTTTATTGTTTATTAGTSGAAASNIAASWALAGGTDLDKHVGHKIQVTGKAAMDGAMDRSRTPDTTAAAAGTTAAGTVGTSGTTATAAAEEQRKASAQPRLDVQSVKMVAATCP